MKKKLFRSGNGWAFFMPKLLLEILEVDPNKNFIDVEIENKKLIVKKSAEEIK